METINLFNTSFAKENSKTITFHVFDADRQDRQGFCSHEIYNLPVYSAWTFVHIRAYKTESYTALRKQENF